MAAVEMEIESVRRNSWSDEWTVNLKEKGAERCLPVYVGSRQASLIGRELQGIGYSELEDYVLCLTGIDTANSKVESVIINRFEGNIFYAKLLLSQHDKHCEVDCPTAVALVLAVRAGAPIFVEEAVLNKAAIDLPA